MDHSALPVAATVSSYLNALHFLFFAQSKASVPSHLTLDKPLVHPCGLVQFGVDLDGTDSLILGGYKPYKATLIATILCYGPFM